MSWIANESDPSCETQSVLPKNLGRCFTLDSPFPFIDNYDKFLRLASIPYRYMSQKIEYLRLFTWPQTLALFAVCMTIYLASLIIYRLYLSPVAAFPGPLLARTTHWYEFYYNYVRTGMYYKKIEEFHVKYGKLHEQDRTPTFH